MEQFLISQSPTPSQKHPFKCTPMFGHLAPVLILFSMLVTIAVPCPANAENISANVQIDWPLFLHRNDMLWEQLPRDWDNGPFLANGDLGTIFWQDNDGSMHFEVSRSSLYDHRRIGDGRPLHAIYANCRLPNGHFSISIGNAKPTGAMRLDLWNAEVRGQLISGQRSWQIHAFVPAKADVIVVELIGTQDAPSPKLTWHPDVAMSSRVKPPPELIPYPPQQTTVISGIHVSVQEMPEDARYLTDGKGAGQYATAWTIEHKGSGQTIFFFTTKLSYPGRTAAHQAVAQVIKARELGLTRLRTEHQLWWHSYYPKSFLSIPDANMESFYWIQIYKMGSASRRDGPIVDLMGPWFRTTGWPAIWWNLNIQMTYWPYYIANHLEEAESLNRSLWKNRSSLAENAEPYQSDSLAICRATGPTLERSERNEIGNLPWTMNNLWLYYRSSMDDKYLREQLFPLMKGTFNYLWHVSIRQADGRIALPPSPSPEYTESVENSSYSSANFRWLARAIIEADSRLKTNDPVVAKAHQVLVNLVPYSIDPATGVMVGKDMPFTQSHRHWSHLFMIYPYHEWNWDDPSQRPLMLQSLDNWSSKPQGFAGFSYPVAASMYAESGDSERAVGYLTTFLGKSTLPNTLYREGSPVIETPLGFARALQELLMTSYGGTIRIFPGVPAEWRDASFANLRAEGAFLVSAVRHQGKTQLVTIKSLAGEPCLIRADLSPLRIEGDRRYTITDRGNGVVKIDLHKGESITLHAGESRPDNRVAPVEWTAKLRPWGGGRGSDE